jgi:hypothetical protein
MSVRVMIVSMRIEVLLTLDFASNPRMESEAAYKHYSPLPLLSLAYDLSRALYFSKLNLRLE